MCDIVLQEATELALCAEDLTTYHNPLGRFFIHRERRRIGCPTRCDATFGTRTGFHRLEVESPKLGEHLDEGGVCADCFKRDEPARVLGDGGFKSVNVGVIECLKLLRGFLDFRGSRIVFRDGGGRRRGGPTDGLGLVRKYHGQISVIPIADQVFARERRGNEGRDEIGKCQCGLMHVSFGPENPGEFLDKKMGDSGSRNEDDPLMKGSFCKRGDVTCGMDTSTSTGLYFVLIWCIL